jgi:hypothetical protein
MNASSSWLLATALIGLVNTTTQARVTRIVIDDTRPVAAAPGKPTGIAYEQVAGRAFGELDPKLAQNAIIQDIELAKDTDGKVRYMASFVIYKPVNLKDASGLMWHDVPNRGRVFPYAEQEFAAGDIGLASAWQGDNAGATTVKPKASIDGMQFLQVPVARNADGSPVKGQVLARIVNRAGPASQPLMVQTNPVPYKPASLDTAKATMFSRGRENMNGEVFDEQAIAPTDWAWPGAMHKTLFRARPTPRRFA